MEKTIKRNIPVVGLGCAACVARVQNRLKEVEGVKEASVSLASNLAQVEYDPAVVQVEGLQKAVQEAGYDLVITGMSDGEAVLGEPEGAAEPPEEDPEEEALREAERLRERACRRLKRDMWLSVIIGAAVMLLSFGFVDFKGKGLTLLLLSAVSVFWCGRRFLQGAIRQLRHGRANMDTLVALSTTVSWLFSTVNLAFPSLWTSRGLSSGLYFDSSAMIVAFILVGRVLEERAKNGTTEAIRKLTELQPVRVRARVGDVIKVKPGQRIPVDGVVVDGSSYVDESLLTGEPLAVFKGAGDAVYTGTMNQKGSFRVRVAKTGSDTMLSSIIRMVRDAQGSRSRVQDLVDKVAAVFVPVILVVALAAFCWWTFSGGGLAKGLLTMVSVLVIACPCSLGLATPTALIAGIGKGAGMGILIKDADSLQVAGKVDTVVLDKTGTLTAGKPSVVGQHWYEPAAKSLLKAMELQSEHPLAEAIVATLAEVEPVSVEQFMAIPGSGAEAVYQGERLFVGNHAPQPSEEAERWLAEGKTVVWFSDERRLLAVYAFEDELNASAAQAVVAMKALGLRCYMLTGDSVQSARLVAGKAGVDGVTAGVLPGDKLQFIKDLQSSGHKVAMVGDGINDSAALAQADLSVAMGGGSDIAMDAAMVTLVSSDLARVPQLIELSRKTVRIIRENLLWAFLYNVLAVPAAAGVFGFSLSPMVAAACMALSSVCVVTNSLRLRR